jgi:hypothetical protein
MFGQCGMRLEDLKMHASLTSAIAPSYYDINLVWSEVSEKVCTKKCAFRDTHLFHTKINLMEAD